MGRVQFSSPLSNFFRELSGRTANSFESTTSSGGNSQDANSSHNYGNQNLLTDGAQITDKYKKLKNKSNREISLEFLLSDSENCPSS